MRMRHDASLDALLDLDGLVLVIDPETRHWVRIVVRRVPATEERPHGLDYSLTLHGPAIYAEMEAMQSSGMTPMQVIVASTATASRAMGLDKQVGTIEKGKAADLVITGADPSLDVANFRRIRYVVRSGVVRPMTDLHALAQF